MKKLLTLFTLLLCVCSGAWATDIVPSFVAGNAANQAVKTNVTSFGDLYFASRSTTTTNSPTGHTNYRTPKGNFVFELTNASTIDITFYSTSARSVKVGLYTIDETTFQVWQAAAIADPAVTMDAWLVAHKDDMAADGETTLDAYYIAKGFKVSSGHLTTGSDNQKNLIPESTSSADGLTNAGKNIYSKVYYPDEATSITQNGQTVVHVNNGNTIPAGKYIMTIGDSGSNMGIEKITITSATPTLTGAFSPSSAEVTQGDAAPSLPTYTVTASDESSTDGKYDVAYSLKAGSTDGIFTYTAEGGISNISTSTVGTATIVATLSNPASGYEIGTATAEYTVTVNAPTTPITLAWDKSSDIAETGSAVVAPVFSNDGGLTVNTTNFNFAITGTAGIISVADNGVVTIDSSVKGEATVTASVIAAGYSADPVAYTIRVADAATKWDFTTVNGSTDQYNMKVSESGWTETESSGNKRYTSAAAIGSDATANGNVLKAMVGLRSTNTVRIDVSEKTGTYGTAGRLQVTADLTLKDLKKGQKITIIYAGANSSNARNITTEDLDNMSGFVAKKSGDSPATGVGYVKEDGDVVLTMVPGEGATGNVVNIAKITVEDYVPVTIAANKEWITYCSTDALDFSDEIDGLEGAYTISAHTSGASTLTATSMTGAVEEGTGLLLHAKTVDAVNPQVIYIPVAASGDEQTGNMLKGVTVATTVSPTDGIYTNLGLKNGAFVPYSASGTIAANKAYLQIPTADMPSADAKLTIVFGEEPSGETDGIKAVSTVVENGVRYNLAGQRVGNDYKGIVIVNGKKMLNK